MMTKATPRVLGAMLRLETFTIADLATHAKVREASARTVVDRNRHLVELVGRTETGRRGGQPIQYRVAEGKRELILALVPFLEDEEGEPMTRDLPAAADLALEAAILEISEHFVAASEASEKRALLRLAERSVNDSSAMPGSARTTSLREGAKCMLRLAELEGMARASAKAYAAILRDAAKAGRALRDQGDIGLATRISLRAMESPLRERVLAAESPPEFLVPGVAARPASLSASRAYAAPEASWEPSRPSEKRGAFAASTAAHGRAPLIPTVHLRTAPHPSPHVSPAHPIDLPAPAATVDIDADLLVELEASSADLVGAAPAGVALDDEESAAGSPTRESAYSSWLDIGGIAVSAVATAGQDDDDAVYSGLEAEVQDLEVPRHDEEYAAATAPAALTPDIQVVAWEELRRLISVLMEGPPDSSANDLKRTLDELRKVREQETIERVLSEIAIRQEQGLALVDVAVKPQQSVGSRRPN